MFDLISTNMFDILTVTMLLLAVFWKLSLATGTIVIVLCAYYIELHSKSYKNFAVAQNEGVPSLAEAQQSLNVSSQAYKELRTRMRSYYWKILYVVCLVCLMMTYYSRFIEVIYLKELSSSDSDVSISKYFSIVRFLSLFMGFYHGEESHPTTFANDTLGYFLFFVLLLLERKSAQWYFNHMDVNKQSASEEDEYVETADAGEDSSHCMPVQELIQKAQQRQEPEEESVILSVDESDYGKDLFKSLLVSLSVQYYNVITRASQEPDYYKYQFMKALKTLLEEVILFLILISCVFKENVFAMLFLGFLLVFLKNGSSLRTCIWLHNYFMGLFILQYFMSLATISDEIAPQSKYYPYINSDCTQVIRIFGSKTICPLYKNLKGWGGWADYLALGDSQDKLDFLAIDIITFVLFSAYFHFFCHAVYEKDIVSTEDDEQPQQPAGNQLLPRDLDPSPELQILSKRNKQKTLLKSFCRIMQKVVFQYLHILTLLIILLLATRSQGLVSVGYLMFCLVFLFQNRHFAQNCENWKYPAWLKYFLQPYLLIDILTQFVIRMPFDGKSTDSAIWRLIFMFQPLASDSTVILKLIIFTMVSLQEEIFESNEFARFNESNSQEHAELTYIKGLCSTYLFNNKRITHYKKYQQLKDKHGEKLDKIKEQIEEWNKKLSSHAEAQGLFQLRRLTVFKRTSLRSGNIGELSHSPAIREDMNTSKRLQSILATLDDENTLRKAAVKNNVGALGKFYIWLYTRINHVLFKKGEKLQNLLESAEKGRNFVMSRLEKMAIEYERTKLLLEKAALEAKRGTVKEEPKFEKEESSPAPQHEAGTQQKLESRKNKLKEDIEAFVRFGHIMKHYWMCIYRILMSSTQFYCFFFMILDHLFNSSAISLVYPISVFVYGLVEHCRPRAMYWSLVLIYTELVLAVKYFIQLDVLTYFISHDDLNAILVDYNRIGLKVFDSTSSSDFFKYILFECLIALFTLIHQYVLIFLGIYDKRELEQESITQAIDRICTKGEPSEAEVGNNSDDSSPSSEDAINVSEGNRSERLEPLSRTTPVAEVEEDRPLERALTIDVANIKEFNRLQQQNDMKRHNSEGLDNEAEEKKSSNSTQRAKLEEEKSKRNGCLKCLAYVAFENPYARTMFPRRKV